MFSPSPSIGASVGPLSCFAGAAASRSSRLYRIRLSLGVCENTTPRFDHSKYFEVTSSVIKTTFVLRPINLYNGDVALGVTSANKVEPSGGATATHRSPPCNRV